MTKAAWEKQTLSITAYGEIGKIAMQGFEARFGNLEGQGGIIVGKRGDDYESRIFALPDDCFAMQGIRRQKGNLAAGLTVSVGKHDPGKVTFWGSGASGLQALCNEIPSPPPLPSAWVTGFASPDKLAKS